MEFQQTNILSMTGNDNFATTSQLANYVDLTSAQTISGLKTFNALPISSIVPTTTTQLVNKSYVDGLGAGYVDLTSAQTITGAKTFNANVRLNNTRNLYLGTTTGGILNYTLPNMYYDINSGGSHYFFVSGSPNLRIETAGLFIENGKYINWFGGSYFNEVGASSRLDYFVPSGFSHNFKINTTTHLQVIEDINGTFWKMPNSTIREQTIFPALVLEVPDTYAVRMTINNQDALKVEYDNTNGSILTFSGGSVMREYLSFSWMLYQVPISYIYKWDIDGTMALQLSSSGILVGGGGTISIQSGSGGSLILDDSFVGGRISGTGGNVRFDADIGADFKFVCDSTLALTIQATGPVVPSNLNIQYGVVGSSIGYSAGTNELQYKAPLSKTHSFYVNAIKQMSIDASGIVMGSATNINTIYLDSTKTTYIKGDGNGAVLGATTINYGSSSSMIFNSGGITQNTINLSGLTIYPDNGGVIMGLTNGATTCRIQQNTATTSIQYSVPTGYFHRFRTSGTTTRMDIIDTGLKVYQGYYIKQGSGTTIFGASVFNNYWTGVAYQAWIDGTNIGNYTICDYRIKENIQPARPVLERLCKIEMVEYEIKDVGIFKKHGTHHGMMAHQVKELFPELDNIVSGEKDAVNESGEIQPQTICAEFGNLAITAIQELNAKIEAQQKQIEAQQAQIDGLLVAMAKLQSP